MVPTAPIRRPLVWALPAVMSVMSLAGCDELKPGDTGAGACEAAASNTGWPANAEPIEVGQNLDRDLSCGEPVGLDWASDSSVACFPDTEFQNFDGNHQFFWFRQPEASILTATVVPEAGVDVSVYMIQSAGDRYEVPPDVVAAISCECSYDDQTDSNPGETESVSVTATTNAYDVLIGVAGAGGTDSGSFRISVQLEQ